MEDNGAPGSPALTAISDLRVRELARVRGRIVSLTYPSWTRAPLVRAQVRDETGVVDVCWQGRSEIPGLRVGIEAIFTARVGERGRRITMLNPAYQVLDTTSEES